MLDKFLEPKFVISVALLGVSGVCLFLFPDSDPHMTLGTSIVTGIAGYWIGSSISSSNKDKVIAGKIEAEG